MFTLPTMYSLDEVRHDDRQAGPI